MATFTTSRRTDAVLAVERSAVWAVLTDPALLAELTPMLRSIEADGDLWTWRMTRVPGLSIAVSPEFTERMVFTEPSRIEFTHDPPAGADEDAAAVGRYVLEDRSTDDGPATYLEIDLEITVDLPLPRIAAPAVKAAMRSVVTTMGNGFGANLERHLGLRGS